MFLPLKLGQQLKVHGENAIIQFIHPTSRRLQIQTDDGVSESMTLCRFHELYLEGSLVLCGDDNLRTDSIQQGMTDVPFHLFLSKEDQKQVDRKNGYLKCVTLESGRWNENTEERQLAVQEHANTINDSKAPSESTLRRWYTRLRVYKSDIRELTPRHRKKGNRCLKLEPEVEEALNLAINQCYLKTSKHNARFVYEHIFVPMFAEGGSLSNYKPPSYKTFSNRVRKTPAYEKKLKREGYFKASMAFPNGRPVVKAAFPGERYEIDHTPADVLIVDSDGKVLGRPNLTFIIDSYSRVIVGMFTSMGPVDRRSVLKAIIHAILPKDYIHEKYPDLKHSWEFFGLFSQLVSDNGMDLLAMDVKAALFDLAIDYTQHPKKKPNRKGKVERSFGTANTELFHNLPGTTFKDYVQRGDYKSNEEACLTFEEYLEFLHRWIVDIYHVSVHRGLGDTPMNVWKKGIKNFQPPVLPSSIETLNNILLENEVRKLQKYGVEIFGMRYNSEGLMNIAKKHGFSIKVDVFYNPDDISTVKVLDPDSKTYVKARCEQYAYIKDGLSLSDHNLVKSEVRKAGYSGKTITETMLVKARRDLYAAIQKAVEKNTKKTKSVRHKQDQERKKTSADVDGSLKPLAPKGAPKVRDEEIRENIKFNPVVFA